MVSLKSKAIKGLSWSAFENTSNLGLNFLVGIILARILTPSEFGLIGITTIFIAVSSTIVDSGFSSALIRKKNTNSKDYNTVFYFNLLAGILLYILLFFCAPAIASFFKDPTITSIIRAMGIVLIFGAFGSIQKVILTKQINFKTQSKISIFSSILSGVIGVYMAFNGFGVWSLVLREISRQFFSSILFWIFNKWRPNLEFSIQSFKELFGFGSKLLFTNLLETLYKNIYYLIIGRFFTLFELGQYTRAEQFNSIFSSNLSSIIQRVSFPVFSELQHNDDKLKQAFKEILQGTMLIAFSLMFGLVAVAEPLILVLIGDKWLQSVSYLQIIALGGMIYPLHALNIDILMVKGKSDLFLKIEIIKKTIAVIPILLGIFYGIEFMLWGSVIISFVSFFANSFYSKKLIDYSSFNQIKDIFPTFLISFFVAFFMWSLTLLDFKSFTTLLLQCILGLLSFIVIYRLFNISGYISLLKSLKSLVK